MRQTNDQTTERRRHPGGRAALSRFSRRVAGSQSPGGSRPGVMHQNRASIALVGAAVIAMLISMAALAVDLGTLYLAKTAGQRTADSAAYAGALAYNASTSTTTMSSAAGNLATLNGISAGSTSASLVTSPSGNGNNAVKVTVATAATLYLARVFQSATALSVTATSYAEVRPSASACILALQSGASGVTLSGGTSVTAANCAIASNATVGGTCGTITTKTVDYNSISVPSLPCGGINPPSGTASVNKVKIVTADPLGASTAVANAFIHLASVASVTGPSGPTVPGGTTILFGYSSPTPAQLLAVGCTGSFASPVWTLTCPAGGTYDFNAISLSGGITLNFAVSGSATNSYNFNGAIDLSNGAGGSFGPGTYNIKGGIITGGGSVTTFANGNYTIGAGTVSCGGSFYSVCNNGTSLSFGAGGYSIAGGVYNNGGATLSIGAGSALNSFAIGGGSAGYAINTAGGSTTTLGDMTSGTFLAAGNISTGGGSMLTLSAAPAHDLNGTFALAGGAVLGAGTYTVAGNFSLGTSGGGGTVSGSGVSMIISGSFAVAAGYNSVTLTAPATGTLRNLVVASNGTGGASFAEGASGNSLSGVFYFPNAPITLSGAGNVGGGVGQCLELIGSTITLTGGSALASTCAGLGASSSGGTVVLVQ
jgi:hypothetical protein